jgi:hypothetical protein
MNLCTRTAPRVYSFSHRTPSLPPPLVSCIITNTCVFCVTVRAQAEAEHAWQVEQGKASKDAGRAPLEITEMRHALRNTERLVDNNMELFEAQRVEDVKVRERATHTAPSARRTLKSVLSAASLLRRADSVEFAFGAVRLTGSQRVEVLRRESAGACDRAQCDAVRRTR